MKIWIDIKNSHEPLFFRSIMKHMPEHEYYITCRDYAEIVDLLKKYEIPHNVIGRRIGGNIIARLFNFTSRVIKLGYKVPKFDISLSHSSIWSTYASILRRRKNIVITDNDIDHQLNKKMFKHVDYLIVPKCIPKETLINDNMKEENIHSFDGFKEQVYISDYSPDLKFKEKIPFKEFITIRPEALEAIYLPKNAKTLVPKLMKQFKKDNINILLLPRYLTDKKYTKNYSNVFIPQKPLNGLDICYYSKAILTGSGTLGREAAILGKPSIQFYPGDNAHVDKELIKQGRMYYSINPKDIVEYILNSKERKFDKDRCIAVRNEVIGIIRSIINCYQ